MKVKDVYTHGHHRSVVAAHASRTVENSAKFLVDKLPMNPQKTKLLDVGCGPGSITLGFAQRCGSVVGFDASEEVIDVARTAAKEQALDTKVDFRVADVYQMPWEDNFFDVVFAHQVLQHLSDPVSALKEMKRVVKPGGCIAVRDADYCSMQAFPALQEIDSWRRIYREVCFRNNAQPDAGRYLLSWCLKAGFQRDRVDMSSTVVDHFSPADISAWGFAWKDRALHSAFAKQAVEYGLATQQDLEAISNAWERWTHFPDACFYYVNLEALAFKEDSSH